jgi:hypothetical protein
VSHKFPIAGELCYLEKYKEGKVVANYEYPVSGVGIFFFGQIITAVLFIYFQ